MTNDHITDNDETDSVNEALCEMLGITSFGADSDEDSLKDRKDSMDGYDTVEQLDSILERHNPLQEYQSTSIFYFPNDASLPPDMLRLITNEIVWGDGRYKADRTYEVINHYEVKEDKETCDIKNTMLMKKRELTRLENFVDSHEKWKQLCHGYLATCASHVMGEEMILFKEKLNLKPCGGSGFAPHLDTPSLRVALGDDGPQTFITLMVAIDDMTEKNGCFKICKGTWAENNHCELVKFEENGDPDAGGRAGAIAKHVADSQHYQSVYCRGGDIVAFSGWAPHRSATNSSLFPRRAVFLTYNPRREGDFHAMYYEKMKELRDRFRHERNQLMDDEQSDRNALLTVPR